MAYRGLSTYAGMNANFPRAQALEILKNSPAPCIAIVWGTFGSEEDLFDEFTKLFADRPHLIEVHYANEVGRRNRRLGPGEMFPKLDAAQYNKALEHVNDPRDAAGKKVLLQRAKNITRLIREVSNSHTNVVISTGLEDNYTNAAYQNVYSIIRSVWPGTIVRNPVGSNPNNEIAPAKMIEFHNEGKARGLCIVNEDGTVHNNQQTKKWLSSRQAAFAAFIWRAQHQGYSYKRFIMPLQRTFRISDSDVNNLGAILRG